MILLNVEELGYKKQDEIVVIEDPVTAVRQVPDVYLGALGNIGFLNMAREIIQNSLDEISKGYSLDKTIDFFYDARDHTIKNVDYGQGIELDKLIDVFSKLHSSSNYNKVSGSSAKSAGKNGQGSKIVNFLSRFFIVESYRLDGSAAKVEFIEGHLTKKGLQKIKCPNGKHGLITSFSPSAMMGNITVSIQEIEQMLWMQCNIYPIGVKINYSAIDEQGNQYTNTIINKKGLKELLNTICEKEIFEPIYFNVNTPEKDYECIFTYDIKNMNDPVIMPFANMCYTTGGTQVKGFLTAISAFFRKYMNTIYLAKNKKLQVNSTDITTGLRAIISSKSLTPIFTGQSKDFYSEVEMEAFAYNVTTNALTEWSKQQPSSLQKLCKYYKDVCEIRSKIDNEKIKMRDKYTASALHNRPAKYKQPTNSHLPFEVVICEGDSALGGMVNNRNRERQGIFPIRGKILNCFNCSTKSFFENEEIAGMFNIFGYNGYSSKFDPEAFRPDKVIIATDADPDGLHITSLMLLMFLRYLPFTLMGDSKIYGAVPPLYGLDLGKNKVKFFRDKVDFVDWVRNSFSKEYIISDYNTHKPLSKNGVLKLLVDNMDYVKLIRHVSSIFAIDSYLLELILYNKDESYRKFKSTIEKAFPYTTVSMQNNNIMIRGLVGSSYQTIFFNDMLLHECKPIIDIINKSDKYYLLNNKRSSLYDVMIAFDKYTPSNINRYKGLGKHIAA